jgi:zinc transporter ZupT
MTVTEVLVLTFVAALVTDLATGLGVIPVFFVGAMSDRIAGVLTAIAAGMMVSASVMLMAEGAGAAGGSLVHVVLGLGLGGAFFALASRWVHGHETFDFAGLRASGGTGALLVVAAMTIHSLPEGIAVGVSFGTAERTHSVAFGMVMSAAIALHNIPEGLAIAMALRPKGISAWRCVWWAIFSSLPQPIAAVPAAWAVWLFQPLLPGAMGFAAGAMIWLVVSELAPECAKQAGVWRSLVGAALGFAAMWGMTVALGAI